MAQPKQGPPHASAISTASGGWDTAHPAPTPDPSPPDTRRSPLPPHMRMRMCDDHPTTIRPYAVDGAQEVPYMIQQQHEKWEVESGGPSDPKYFRASVCAGAQFTPQVKPGSLYRCGI